MRATTRNVMVGAVIAVALANVGWAQDSRGAPGRGCGPAGTWLGQNETYGHEFLITIEPIGSGRYSVVSEGIEITPPWEVSTAGRGTIQRIDGRVFHWWGTSFAGPSQLTDPTEGVPDIVAIEGEMTMLDCNHFEVDFGEIGVYAWGQIPFRDEPLATAPPSYAVYTRVPSIGHNREETE